MKTFFELAGKRQSCRSFSERPVERKKLMACVEAAGLAPSACNSQPWHFVVVNNPELCSEVAQCVQGQGMNPFADQCTAFIVVIEEEAKLLPRFKDINNQKHAQLDVGIATAHLLLAAEELGLATCPIGWINEQRLADVLGLDMSGKRKFQLVIGIGYARKDVSNKKRRKPINEIVTYIG